VGGQRKWRVKPAVTLAAAVLVGGLILAAVLLRPGTNGSPSTSSGPSNVAAVKRAAFPVPPRGAVVFSRQMGGNALALGVVPRRGQLALQASVVGSRGEGVPGLSVGFTVHGVAKPAASCGAGCYRAVLPTSGRPVSVQVEIAGRTTTHWDVALPGTWPPRDAAALVARAGRVWRALRSLSFTESLASDTRHRVVSTWRLQAPDRLAYQIKGGWAGIVVGERRWDRPPNGRWVPSAQSRLPQPVPFWAAVADAHVLGKATLRGRSALLVSFFDPQTPAWFKVALDERTLHTLDLHMVTTAHFMHDAYSSFNTAPPVTPPR
jgi:hypothetical protein